MHSPLLIVGEIREGMAGGLDGCLLGSVHECQSLVVYNTWQHAGTFLIGVVGSCAGFFLISRDLFFLISSQFFI